MAKGAYEVFATAWSDHLIKVRYQANWLNLGPPNICEALRQARQVRRH